MDTAKLKRFAQDARRMLIEQVETKLKTVLREDSLARRESKDAIKSLEEQIAKTSRDRVVERVAYLWFNRLCAFRYMDVNGYTKAGVVSPREGHTQPEILAEAKAGQMSDELEPFLKKDRLYGLLTGTVPSNEPQQEVYRMLLVASCNQYHKLMPFLFEKIEDFSELLLPDDLLSDNSIVAFTRDALSAENCENVEVIGWLYQFYISEKKDKVFADLKKNKKITAENIPAATQLFTPHWIVRYMVENSLGRLWMLNRPTSRLIEKMDYFIKPEQQETDFLKISSPEEIKFCDPACGSGHILVYAFELLYSIYEEEGYDAPEIPALILKNNLFGIEIDERAAELAALALVMMAREKHRRFFRNPIQPNICVMERVEIEKSDLEAYMQQVGRDLFTANLEQTLEQFRDADNFGSLVRPAETDVSGVRKLLETKGVEGNLFLAGTHENVLKILTMVEYLSPRYQVVVANPPYMGGKGMNEALGKFAKTNYPDSKSDLFAMFIERNFDLVVRKGCVGMITMQSWMFLSSYEGLRKKMLENDTILSMAHLGARGFDSIGGEVVQTTAFVIEREHRTDHKGDYLRLIVGGSETEKQNDFKNNRFGGKLKFTASAEDFGKIPGSPIAYWLSYSFLQSYAQATLLGEVAKPCQGMATADNERFLREWWEVQYRTQCFGAKNAEEARSSKCKWFPYNKGGTFRKWYGNGEFVVDWENDGERIKDFSRSVVRNEEYYFQEGLSWTAAGGDTFAIRKTPVGFLFDVKGSSCFSNTLDLDFLLAFLSTKYVSVLLNVLNPTIEFQNGNLKNIPIKFDANNLETTAVIEQSNQAVVISKYDWDSSETSWDFRSSSLITAKESNSNLAQIYATLYSQWKKTTFEMKRLEEDNNRIFIEVYCLQNELTPDVPLKEITLTCNPYYRYGDDKTEEQLEGLLLQDTMKEFISYSVGCMFGRYSLDKPGLILANQGETLEDYLKQVPQPTFIPDEDNVIPLMDSNWFEDDIVERFKKFLKVTFGEENYDENLRFIEDALGYKTTGKGKPLPIRDYFLNSFYNDHIKTYKKRPIYWMFSSPKGTFNAFIYMHRYRPDTVSRVLTDYLRVFRNKLAAYRDNKMHESISQIASAGQKTAALKEIEKINKQIAELDEYERDVLYPLASENTQIDLDDGVKKNYTKFGKALKAIPGLDKGEE